MEVVTIFFFCNLEIDILSLTKVVENINTNLMSIYSVPFHRYGTMIQRVMVSEVLTKCVVEIMRSNFQ